MSNNYIIGEDCEIFPNVVIGNGCKIGNNVTIHPNVVLYDNTVIEDGVEIFENSVIGRPPKSAGNLMNKLKESYGPVIIGKNSVIGVGAVIYAENTIANNVLFGDYACMRESCVVGEYCVIARYASTSHHVTIQSYSKIMDYSFVNAHSIVEDHVFIGANIITTSGADMRLTGESVGIKGRVIFKKGCRIGSGAIFLPGTTVGEYAVVGAGAVVTKDVADNATVMGIPAKEKLRGD